MWRITEGSLTREVRGRLVFISVSRSVYNLYLECVLALEAARKDTYGFLFMPLMIRLDKSFRNAICVSRDPVQLLIAD